MSGRHPSRPRPPWETQEQPLYTPDDTWYGQARGPRVVIKPHAQSAGGGGRQGRYTEPRRQSRRRVTLVSVAVGLVAAVGIAAAVVQFTHVGWGQVPAPATQAAATVTTPAPTPTPTPTPTASKSGAGTAQTAYVLEAPATAGGYTLTTPTLPAIQAVGSAGAVALMTAVKAAGGKPRSNVSGEYLISGDQALGYSGYTGTFSPAAVISAFKAGASSATTEAAGPHGGELACGEVTATAASGAATPGTACVWATTTTVGMVEFFAGSDLETVLHSKADSDTLKFRADVETLKGAAQP
jgi:cytoskeletal protein RodZ